MWQKIKVAGLLLSALMMSSSAWAQDKGTFMVQDGAFPWFDRVDKWALADVPDSLKGNGPLPQQNCGARALEIAGQPSSITFGVADADADKFKTKFPKAQETGEKISVRNAAGTNIGYRVLSLANPPAKIGEPGDYSAGLLLLQVGASAANAGGDANIVANAGNNGAAAPTPPVGVQPARVEKGQFVVEKGAFPWSDRSSGANVWVFDRVPDSLQGTGPLPQQNCSSRVLSIPGQPSLVTIGVSEKDIENFKNQYPTATATGETIGIVNPQGAKISYSIFTFPKPPEVIGTPGEFQAGLLLLKIEGGTAANPARQVPPTKAGDTALAPVTAVAPQPATPHIATTPAAAPLAPPAAATLPDKANLHIYLLMGQSNMVGRDITTLAAQIDNPHIVSLDSSNKWVVAREPMFAGGTGIGPGTSFASEMLKANPNVTIGLVQSAVGGTPLSRWVKGGDLYEKAVSRAKAAAPVGVIEGVLWHQGESDTGKQADAQSYETRLTQMFKDLRADLGSPNLPIVVGQLGDFLTVAKYPYVDTVRSAISHLPTDLPRVAFATSSGLGHKGDELHFSAQAQSEFGIRYAVAMQALKNAPITKP